MEMELFKYVFGEKGEGFSRRNEDRKFGVGFQKQIRYKN